MCEEGELRGEAVNRRKKSKLERGEDKLWGLMNQKRKKERRKE